MSLSDVSQRRLRSVVEPVVSAEGFEVDSLTVTAAGRRSILRLTVDADDGVDLDSVARVSRAVSDALDEAGAAAFAGPYSLEVSSPGVDRPLTDERHWRRATGRLVTVDVDGKPVTARVTEVEPSGVTLRDAAGRTIVATWSTLGAGRVQVEFNRPAEWETTDENDAGRP
jgi:ribosome maturation factor RimP